MSLVELVNVRKSFGEVDAVKGISLSIGPGEVLGLFGHNGAGKTTTMKMILGLLEPTSGSVKVLGHAPWEASFSQYRYQIGFLPENVSFYQQLTGAEVLRHFARLKRVSISRVDQLLERVGLAHAAKRKVKTYSKGMKQRLGLAQALLCEPKLLLLDEPTVGLDPIATQDFYSMVDELKQHGCAVILCSHVLPGVEKHIDRAAILGKGQLQALGTLEHLRQEAALPMRIRVQGRLNREELQQRLASQSGFETRNFRQINGHALEFESNQSGKMALLRDLLSHPCVDDVDIHLPSLEQLYRHFVEAALHSEVRS
ncbi:MAG: ABC transporter ATP-binding protein [Hahellaceae bacterium]|nr:ABC transporter ATP-binding protein [Hahellaceae bacterium]MCP5169662.1 ABC transporter ATP-binding protein [Hahellaceae bacterium]